MLKNYCIWDDYGNWEIKRLEEEREPVKRVEDAYLFNVFICYSRADLEETILTHVENVISEGGGDINGVSKGIIPGIFDIYHRDEQSRTCDGVFYSTDGRAIPIQRDSSILVYRGGNCKHF